MMRVDIKRTKIYKEFDKETNGKYFNTKNHAVIEKVDSLYYNVFLSEDTNDNNKIDSLFSEIDILRETFKETKEEQFYKDLEVKLGGYSIYSYRLSCSDLYDIFISNYLPNKKTARVVIQLRSFGLWVHGVDDMLELSFNKLKEIFKDYDISIDRTLENRFDYCYHTNMIQNSKNYFSDDKLLKHCVSTMNIYSKVGNARLNNNTDNRNLTVDYFSLGNRTSNNVFIRIYDKTREVVEMGYKSFFIEYWYKNRMISFYDKYCIEIAYKKKNYDALHLARLHFYLDYGTNTGIKNKIINLISDSNSRYKDFKQLADNIMPSITIVNNIEFETKRNFYRFSDKQIDGVLETNCTNELRRVYKIYHNRDIFLKYLTSKTLCFVKEIGSNDFMDWWKRIANKKLSNCNKTNTDIIREYSKEIDLDASLTRTINSIGTTSIYKGNKYTSLTEDIGSMIGMLNDNDIYNEDNKIALVNSKTGEIINYVDEKKEKKYFDFKQKKYSHLKNRLPSTLHEPQESSINQ